MPPLPLEYQGAAAIGAFLSDRADARGTPLRLVATRANGQPAFGCYLPPARGGTPFGLLVVGLAGGRIAELTWFAEPGSFERFGLTSRLREDRDRSGP